MLPIRCPGCQNLVRISVSFRSEDGFRAAQRFACTLKSSRQPKLCSLHYAVSSIVLASRTAQQGFM